MGDDVGTVEEGVNEDSVEEVRIRGCCDMQGQVDYTKDVGVDGDQRGDK